MKTIFKTLVGSAVIITAAIVVKKLVKSNTTDKKFSVGFKDKSPQYTDCGKQKIRFSKGKIDVINITTIEEDPGCYFSAGSRLIGEPFDNLTKVVCKENNSTEFVLPKGEERTILFEGRFDILERLRYGKKDFCGEYKVKGV